MPVYDTGPLLVDSVRSVLRQSLIQLKGPSVLELLVIDDGSADPKTLEALDEVAAMSPIVRVLRNRRAKGAAGARNTGVFEARGKWVGFLDSDDLLYADYLLRQSEAIDQIDGATWVASHFHVGDAEARPREVPLSQRSPSLFREIEPDYVDGRPTRLRRPVSTLLRCGCIGIFTAAVQRDALLAVGGFDESLAAAEDYDLWLRLAIANDLHVLPFDAGVYRIRDGSLTRSGRPLYWYEDRMLQQVRVNPKFNEHGAAIRTRLRSVYEAYCNHYRRQGDFAQALLYARRLVRVAPLRSNAWRQLVAGVLRAG